MENELTELQQRVLSLIGKGKENKVNVKYISKLLDISTRQVTYTIVELREHYPICSTTLEGGGVWIADCNKDIVQFVKHLQKLKNAHQTNINFMERHIK